MSVLKAYQDAIHCQDIQYDAAQFQVVRLLEKLYQTVHRPFSIWEKVFCQKLKIKGIYLWGGVGVGKTFLMDLFYYHTRQLTASRMHFHDFMRYIHANLKLIQGESDPLKKIAKHMAHNTRILCLDEFFVSDITDAMLLANLLSALFMEKIILITTSNVPPQSLYQNGLQRCRFLAAIDLIEAQCEVCHLSGTQDHRFKKNTVQQLFFYPLNEDTEKKLEKIYREITRTQTQQTMPLFIFDRFISVRKRTETVVWFEFDDLCNQPRAQSDYIQLARQFKTVILSNIPIIHCENKIIYFIYLIDILYDYRVKLILSSAVPVIQLHPNGLKKIEYQRTLSRLQEMQSECYFITN